MWRGVKKLYRNWLPQLLELSMSVLFAIIIGFYFFQIGSAQADLTPRLGLIFYSIARTQGDE